jgi:enoyl-CoA hydratase
MRYMLTGDHWSADDTYRMGLVLEIVPSADAALTAGIGIANKIASCAQLASR